MSFNFDLNLPVTNDERGIVNFGLEDERECLFDLNKSPVNEESVNDGDVEFPHYNSLDVDGDVEFPSHNNPNDLEEDTHNQDVGNDDEARHVSKNLSNKDRWAIYNALLERTTGGIKKKNTTREVSNLFGVSIQTVQRIWNRAKETAKDGDVNVSHRRSGKCGRKQIPLDSSKVLATPLHKRTTIRSLSASVGMSLSTLHRRVKRGDIRRHTNAIKPGLNEESRKKRLEFCLSMLDKNSLPFEPKFIDMYNIVHIDEKWFNMTRKMQKYYLLPSEEEPYRTCQSKNFITKVMFMAAMARPRFDEEGNEVFSGKIGIFPFVSVEPAKRTSKNRKAGTLEMKACTSVKREDIKACLINKVIPMIHARWPEEDRGKTIFIQQDNARTHIACGDKEFNEAASKNGFDIRLMCQPPSSPDLNILDLGFFSAIQAIQHQTCPKTVEDLVRVVEESFEEYKSESINCIFLTLQTCMKEVMKIGGLNKYNIPHMKKSTLQREGRLPIQISCDASLVENVMNMLASRE